MKWLLKIWNKIWGNDNSCSTFEEAKRKVLSKYPNAKPTEHLTKNGGFQIWEWKGKNVAVTLREDKGWLVVL